MKRRDYHALSSDIRRVRPLIVIVLAVIVLLPSIDEMLTQDLSPLSVLVRLAESLFVLGLLVWSVSAVVLYYARIQVESHHRRETESGTNG
jgi:uncharacterized protein YqhQ